MANRSLVPIKKDTLQDRIYAQLKLALMSGAFAPGQSVTLRGVAQQLGTSAMPIRDAIRRLVSDHALEMPSLRSIRVPVMSVERHESVLRVRKLLEGEAAAIAALKASREDVAQLVRMNADYADALTTDDVAAILTANRVFHFEVYRLAADPLLLALIEKAWLLSGPYLNLLRDRISAAPDRRSYVSKHDVLIKALRLKNSERARAAVAADIEDAADLYRDLIRQRTESKFVGARRMRS
ncbi:MAG: GntR family transcriptional regulator [Phycisphaerae bacterium]|nr:GntR family transcriptional regulator [Phycisphaerae bacterium]